MLIVNNIVGKQKIINLPKFIKYKRARALNVFKTLIYVDYIREKKFVYLAVKQLNFKR